MNLPLGGTGGVAGDFRLTALAEPLGDNVSAYHKTETRRGMLQMTRLTGLDTAGWSTRSTMATPLSYHFTSDSHCFFCLWGDEFMYPAQCVNTCFRCRAALVQFDLTLLNFDFVMMCWFSCILFMGCNCL